MAYCLGAPSHCLNQCWNIVYQSLGTNLSENLIQMQTFLLKEVHLKISSGKWRPFRLDLNVLIYTYVHLSALIHWG